MSNCPTPENIAVWLDGERSCDAVTSHIAQCAMCADFAQELKANQALFRSIPVIPESAYAEVRLRVLEQTTVRRRHSPYWVTAAIAAALLIATFVRPTHTVRPVRIPQPEPGAVFRAERHTAMAPVRSRQAARKHLRRARRPRVASSAELIAAFDRLYEHDIPPAPGAAGETVITMQTQDADVLVILLADRKGDEE